MFTVTDEWLVRFSTDAGSWTRDQLKCIGVKWPPVHGWKRAAAGRQISEQMRLRFEQRLNRKQLRERVRCVS